MKKMENVRVKIIPLGGLELIGMNITAIEYEDSIVVIDCGLSFPEDDMLSNVTRMKHAIILAGQE